MEKLKDLLLFLSAFVPMFVLILLRLVIDMINTNLSFNVLNTLNMVTLILLIICGCYGLYYNIHSNEGSKPAIILSKENITDQHFLGYFSLFVLFALQLELTLVSGYILFVCIMVFIGIVYIKNSLFYINPLLNLLGYNFYTITYKLEGKSQLREAKMFYKGELETNKKYMIKIKNQNFTFIDNQKTKKNDKK